MTNASECRRDAAFVCGGDRFVVFDRSAETGDWGQACDLRFSVACHCASEPDFEIAGSCGSSAEPLAVLKNEPVEIVLLDFDLGGDHASQFISSARRHGFEGKS